MSQSDGLSKRHLRDGGGKSINTDEAKVHDVKVRDVMIKLHQELVVKYPQHTFRLESVMKQSDIAKGVNHHYTPSNPRSTIRPDGGILFMNDKPILSTEAKKQGTNSKRCEEGKKPQAMGNAIERSHKNYNELKNLFDPYPYFPYLVFCYGCDFKSGSSIVDRLSAMTYYDSFNTLHIQDTIVEKNIGALKLLERNKKASVFIQVLPYSFNFIYQVSLEAVNTVISLQESNKI
jgi:type II restriction enzyme